MENPIDNTEAKRKRLLFRSKHRGTKEMDILLGEYYEKKMYEFTLDDLIEFEVILNYPVTSLMLRSSYFEVFSQSLFQHFFEQILLRFLFKFLSSFLLKILLSFLSKFLSSFLLKLLSKFL